jgi:hypothetical protein
MNVVLAQRAGKGCIHFFHVEPAMRHLRMAGFARRPRVLIVAVMTRDAAQTLVNAYGCAIVA